MHFPPRSSAGILLRNFGSTTNAKQQAGIYPTQQSLTGFFQPVSGI